MKMGKTVGIVPFASGFDTEKTYEDKYFFTNTYGIRASEAGLSPIGVLPVDREIKGSVLSFCDCFILIGGRGIGKFHMEVIDHAVKNGKKVLGICLGCQAIGSYFRTADIAAETGWEGSIADLYMKLRVENSHPFLKEVKGHRPGDLLRGRADELKHKVTLVAGTNVRNIIGSDSLMGASLHIYAIDGCPGGLTVSGYTDDGVIEAVEHGDTVIGTQFHPDADDKLPQFFKWLAE